MSLKGEFYVFKTHKAAKIYGCCNCCYNLSKEKHKESEYECGNGKYVIICPICRYSTWYDIENELKKG